MSSQEAYEMAARGLLGPQGKTVPILKGLRCIHFQPPHFTLGKTSSSGKHLSCQCPGSSWSLRFSHPPQRCRLSMKLRNIYAKLCTRLDWSCEARPCVKESGGPGMEASRCGTPSPGNTGQSRTWWRPSGNITCPRKGRKTPENRSESHKNTTKMPQVTRMKAAMTQRQWPDWPNRETDIENWKYLSQQFTFSPSLFWNVTYLYRCSHAQGSCRFPTKLWKTAWTFICSFLWR